MQAFEPFDIVVIVLAIGMTVRGGLSGIASQVLSILSIVLSWYIATRHFSVISGFLPQGNSWSQPVSIFATFILCNIGIRIATVFIQRLIKVGPLKEFDRQLGALLGLVKGLILCLVITFFAVMLSERSRQAVANSQSGKYLVSTILYITNIVPDDVRHGAFKKELVKFTTIVNDSGMATTSVSEEVVSLRKKLEKTVVAPNAAEQLIREKKSGATDSTLSTQQSNSTGQSRSSLTDNINQFFSSMTSRSTTTEATSTKTLSNEALIATPSTQNTHPLEAIAGNFSGFSGDLTFGKAQISVNVPKDGSPLIADVRFPDLDAEISKSTTSTPTLSLSLPRDKMSDGYPKRETEPIDDGQRVYSGSVLQQQTFTPSTVAPSLGP